MCFASETSAWMASAVPPHASTSLAIPRSTPLGRRGAVREEIDAPLPSKHVARYDGAIAAARAVLGDDAVFGNVWRQPREDVGAGHRVCVASSSLGTSSCGFADGWCSPRSTALERKARPAANGRKPVQERCRPRERSTMGVMIRRMTGELDTSHLNNRGTPRQPATALEGERQRGVDPIGASVNSIAAAKS